MSRLIFLILFYTLLCSIISVSCCSRKTDEPYPSAEVVFPGANDLAVKSTKDIAAIISQWTSNLSKVAKFIPYGNIVAPILTGASVMSSLLTTAKTEVGKLIDHNLAVAAVGDVEAKMVTVRNRLEEVDRYVKQGKSFDVPIALAAQQCEEILQKFSYEWNYLFKNDNYLFSSPSLVAFIGVYAGVAGFKFQISPNDRDQVVKEMKLLKTVVEKYRDATVAKRLSYLEIKSEVWNRQVTTSCEDTFTKLTTCSSCSKAICAFAGGSADDRLNNKSFQNFWSYKTSLGEIYSRYFNEPLSELEKLIRKFESIISNQ